MEKFYHIGKIKVTNNIWTAPLAGITDLVFREILTEYGAGLVYTEMISAAGLSRRDKKTERYLKIGEKEQQVAVQIFGNKPAEFAAAAKIISEETKAAVLDINMGCPMKKVTNSGAGAALMKDLLLAEKIIQAVVKNTELPVTVKFRSGWDSKNINFLELGKICEGEGAAAVVLHPRTRAQMFTGEAEWQQIKDLKQNLKIPVIGNGDIRSRAAAKRMLSETACDGVMVGRAAIGNPWLIKSIADDKEIFPTEAERKQQYLEHAKRYLAANPERTEKSVVSEMRKFGARYLKEFDGAGELRKKINVITTIKELEELLK